MKHRQFCLVLIGLGLTAWLAQVTLPLISVPRETLPLGGDELWRDALWELLPYAVLCTIAAFVRVPKVGNWFLCIALILMGGVGISAWIEYATGGGCMRGLGLIMGYFLQCIIATTGILLALIAKAVEYFRRRRAQVA